MEDSAVGSVGSRTQKDEDLSWRFSFRCGRGSSANQTKNSSNVLSPAGTPSVLQIDHKYSHTGRKLASVHDILPTYL